MDTIALAKQIATEAHKGQFRRDGKTPYIEHPKAVVKELRQYYSRRPTKEIVGWLHDVLEDTDLTPCDLLDKGIPSDAVAIIDILTKRKDEDYLKYILRIKRNLTAAVVKIADMKNNSETAALSGALGPTKSQKDKYALAKYILEH